MFGSKSLAVLNFFLVQKLIFDHFQNCKKWILVKKKIREIDLFDFTRWEIFGMNFFKFSVRQDPRQVSCYPNLKKTCNFDQHYNIGRLMDGKGFFPNNPLAYTGQS